MTDEGRKTKGPEPAKEGNVHANPSFVLRLSSFVLWLAAGLLGSLLLLRFGMRALGVRPDIAFPGLVYGLTDPLVQPFYRFLPLPRPYGARFDTPIVETASLAAAAAVFAIALALYVASLVLFHRSES